MSNDPMYLAVMLIMGGGTWHYGSTPKEAAKQVVEMAREDWGEMISFDDRKWCINIFDVTEYDNDESFAISDEGVFIQGEDGLPIALERHSFETIKT